VRIVQTLHAFDEAAPGGSEVYTVRLSQALSRNHEVTIVYPQEDLQAGDVTEEAVSVSGLAAIRLRRPPILDASQMYQSAALDDWFDGFLGRVRPDVVHVQHLLRLSTGWLEVAEAHRIPTVMTLHDLWYLCPAIFVLRDRGVLCPSSRGGSACATCLRRRREWSQFAVDAGSAVGSAWDRIRRAHAWFLGMGAFAHRQQVLSSAMTRLAISGALKENLRLLELPRTMIAPSEFIAHEYRRRGVARPISHLPYGVPFSERVEKTKADHLRVGYLGYVAPHKGVHVAVEAVRRLSGANVSLSIHGHATRAYRKELRRLAGGDSRIRFCGPFFEQDLPSIHADIDVVVTPSLCHENCPLVLQEALALGTPAIVSDRGGMPEVVQDGANGFIVPAGDEDALASLLADLARDRDTVRRLSRDISAPYTIEDNAKAIEGLYEEARAG